MAAQNQPTQQNEASPTKPGDRVPPPQEGVAVLCVAGSRLSPNGNPWVLSAKREETRDRRLKVLIERLQRGEGLF